MLTTFPFSLFNQPAAGGNDLGIIDTDLYILYEYGNTNSYPGSGTAVTDLQGNFDMTLINGVGYSSADSGKLVFDGNNDYGNIDSGFMTGLTNATITTWFYYENNGRWTRVWDFGTGTQNYIFLTPRNGQSYGGQYNVDTLRVGYKYNNGSETLVNMSSQLANNSWHEVTVTLSGTTMTMYHNGTSIGSTTNANTVAAFGTTSNNYIGKAQFPDPYFQGDQGLFFVYNACLSATDVSDNFDAVKGRYGL